MQPHDTDARGGQPLPHHVRLQAQAATGHDFSDVRVHSGMGASQLARAQGAQAYTTGQDIYFKQGEYSPHSAQGQELLAHELTHVVQPGGAPRAH